MRVPRWRWALVALTILVTPVAFYEVLGMHLATYRQRVEPAPEKYRRNPWVRDLYLERPYRDLMRAIRRDKTVRTVWDFDAAVALSSRLFEPTDMYGETKYRYRPDIEVENLRVWTGLEPQDLAFQATPETDALAERVDALYRIRFATDRFGFKKTDFPVVEGRPSVLFLGDSFTEGLWVRSEDTFANRFGHLARDLMPVNTGVNGYSALEMTWTLERFGPMFPPRLVVYNLYPNDVHWNGEDVVEGKAPEGGYDRMFAHLARGREVCRGLGARMVVAVIPEKAQFERLRGHRAFQERVLAWCSAEGVTCLDFQPEIERLGYRNVYLSWDDHFSPDGHRAYAEYLHRGALK